MRKKLTYSFVKNQIENENYLLLSDEYINANSKLKYKCSEGHCHSICWSSWQNKGHRCLSCAIINKSGADHWNWKDGITSLNKAIRDFIGRIGWGDKVFKRDNYTCQTCNKRGGKLHAHHIIFVSDIIETYDIKNIEDARKCKLLYDISNGITLCKSCHKKLHTELKNKKRLIFYGLLFCLYCRHRIITKRN